MPAKSKAQQRFFGMVRAYQKGELENPSQAIKDAAKSISKKEAKKFAETKHKGLPNHVKKEKKTNESIVHITESQFMNVISECIKDTLKESAELYNKTLGADPLGNADWYRGCPGITIRWHGEWSDPELLCDGYLINYYKVEDYFGELAKEDGVDVYNEAKFTKYCQAHVNEIKDYIKTNGKKDTNPFDDDDDSLSEGKKVVKLDENTLRAMVSETIKNIMKENMFEEDGFCINITHLDLNDGHLGADMGYQFDEKAETAKATADEILNDIENYLKSQDFLREHDNYANENQVPIFSIESLPGHEDYADGRCYISELDAQYKEEVSKAVGGVQVVVIPNPFSSNNDTLREGYNQFSDDDFAGEGNPYELVDDSPEKHGIDGDYFFNLCDVEIKGSDTPTPTIRVTDKKTNKTVVLNNQQVIDDIEKGKDLYDDLRIAVYRAIYKWVIRKGR